MEFYVCCFANIEMLNCFHKLFTCTVVFLLFILIFFASGKDTYLHPVAVGTQY